MALDEVNAHCMDGFLSQIRAAVPQDGGKVTLMSDACHSGSVLPEPREEAGFLSPSINMLLMNIQCFCFDLTLEPPLLGPDVGICTGMLRWPGLKRFT